MKYNQIQLKENPKNQTNNNRDLPQTATRGSLFVP